MNNIFSKLKDYTHITRFFDKDPEKLDLTPRKDWMFVVISFLVLSLAFTLFYYFMFLPVGNTEMDIKMASESRVSIENISRAKLEKTLAPWLEKQSKFDEHLKTRPPFDFLR